MFTVKDKGNIPVLFRQLKWMKVKWGSYVPHMYVLTDTLTVIMCVMYSKLSDDGKKICVSLRCYFSTSESVVSCGNYINVLEINFMFLHSRKRDTYNPTHPQWLRISPLIKDIPFDFILFLEWDTKFQLVQNIHHMLYDSEFVYIAPFIPRSSLGLKGHWPQWMWWNDENFLNNNINEDQYGDAKNNVHSLHVYGKSCPESSMFVIFIYIK